MKNVNYMGSEEISEEQVMNDLTYRKMKKQLEIQYSGKYIVIAYGKLRREEDSLEKAWSIASSYKYALVTRISKKPLRAKILGEDLTMIVDTGFEGHVLIPSRLYKI